MSKRLAAALILSLFLSVLTTSNSQAAVRTGDPCKKVGTTSIANGKKFTCIKSGKKTIWNKGVNIPATLPNPTKAPSNPSKIVILSQSIFEKNLAPGDTALIYLSATATTGIKEISGTLKSDSIPLLGVGLGVLKSGTAFQGEWTISLKIPANIKEGSYYAETAVTDLSGNSVQGGRLEIEIGISQINPTPTTAPLIDRQSQYIYRFLNGTLERKIANVSEFTAVDTRLESNFDPIRVKAYRAIREGFPKNSSGTLKVTFDWTIRNSFPKSILEYTKQTVTESGAYWDSVFNSQIQIPVQFVTELDKVYVSSLEMRFSDTLDILDTLAKPGFRNQVPWMGGGGGYWKFKGTFQALMNFQTASYATSEYFVSHWPSTGAHEFTHVIQDYFLRDLDRTVNWTELTADKRSYPHFREGSANTFGFALGMPNLGWYSDGMDWWVWKYTNQFGGWKPSKTEADIVNLLSASESRFPYEAHEISYPLGSLLYEWIIGTYGLDVYLKLLANQIKFDDFGDNIKSSLGISKSELYEKAAPYILNTWNRAKN